MANANWSNPQLTSTYTNFVSEVKNRDEDLALQFDGTTSTNIPTNTIRWDSSANRWKKWSGSVWGELASTYALTGLSTTGSASIGTTLTVTGATTLTGGGTSTTPATDNNSTNIATTAFVVGQASATTPLINGTAAVGTSLRYARQDHVHPTDTTRAPLASPTFTGTVTIPAGASISGYAPLASPSFTGTVNFAGDVNLNSTGYLDLPVGTTAQRPGTPAAGMIRYNSTLGQFEGYGTSWGSIGGGATGGGSDRVFVETGQNVTSSYTLTTGYNAVSAGPVTVASGITVTIPSGAAWSIV
jgi:hypothetical protein